MTDLVERLRRAVSNYVPREGRYELEPVVEEAVSEITRLQSALSASQAQGEVMREELTALVWDVENKIGDPHTLRHAKTALNSTPPTAVARVIEAHRKARTISLVVMNGKRPHVMHVFADEADAVEFEAALAGLDGGRKG